MAICAARSAKMVHEATLMDETTAIGQLTKLRNRDLAPWRAVNKAYQIGTLSKPFDRQHVFFPCSRFSLLPTPSAFSHFSLLLAVRFFPRHVFVRFFFSLFSLFSLFLLLSLLASSLCFSLLSSRFFSLHASSSTSRFSFSLLLTASSV